MYVDVMTNVPVEFEPHQLSLLPPETEKNNGDGE